MERRPSSRIQTRVIFGVVAITEGKTRSLNVPALFTLWAIHRQDRVRNRLRKKNANHRREYWDLEGVKRIVRLNLHNFNRPEALKIGVVPIMSLWQRIE